MKPGSVIKFWTTDEMKTLEDFYPSEGAAVASRLPGRSLTAIQMRASQMGIRRASRKFNRKPAAEVKPVAAEPIAPPKREHGQAANLECLPWLQFPTTATGALKIAKVCGEALKLHDDHRTMGEDEVRFWASVKEYMHALAVRLRKNAA